LKKLLAASFLTLLFTSQLGYYFIYSFQQHLIKERMEKELLSRIPESSLELIIAENYGNKIVWEEKNKEFSIDGVLYDVAKIKKTGGKTYLYCINDKKEKELLDNLVKAVRSSSENSNSNKHSSNSVKFQLCDLIDDKNEAEPYALVSVNLLHISFHDDLVTSVIEVSSPPPKA
jgi:hypothetical protein